MVRQRRSPGVQDTGKPDPRAHSLGVSRNGHYRFGGCFAQQAIHRLLVPIGDLRDLGWQGEDHVEIFHGQQVLGTGLHPVACSWSLTFGAVPVLATVVSDVVVTTLGAARHMPAKRLGPAGFNGMPPLKWSTHWDMIIPFSGGPEYGWKAREARRYRAKAAAS